MKISIANPIYDAVFKYLVDDERVARILLSALLKKEVVEVEMRKHEYPNGERDRVSMFRVDFAARVRQDDGSLRLILIELQKTWVETETLRFRQYLGAQYFDPNNMVEEGNAPSHALPMVTVYLLGHRVGHILEPVIYASHKVCDYDGNEVKEGIPDPFVESLTHDSIVVQIPMLRKQLRNRLDKVLSVFDQSQRNGLDQHMLDIDPTLYEGDTDMAPIMRRLVEAAASPEMRLDMNVEDEYYSALENRDTAIMERDKRIAEQDKEIEERGKTIKEQGKALEEQGKALEEQGKALEEQGKALEERDKALEEQGKVLEEQGKALEEKGKTIEEQGKALEEKEAQLRNMAKAMLANGLPLELVAQVVNKSVDEMMSMMQM